MSAAQGFLRAGEAARRMDIHPATVWRWVQDGVIPEAYLLRRGRTTRIHAAWIDGRHITPAVKDAHEPSKNH